MPLAPVVDKIEDVPEAARPFYVQKDGKFHVDLSAAPAGFVPAADLAAANGKVVEFRDTNIALTKKVTELEPLKTKFEGIDPEVAKADRVKVAELEKKGVKNVDDIQTVVNAALKPVTDALAAITANAQDLQRKNDDNLLAGVIGDKFITVGGEAGAKDFIISKAREAFVVEAGVIKAKPTKFSTDKPGEPLGMDEWLTQQTKDAAFAFKKSGGGGAAPASGAAGVTLRAGQTILKDPTPAQLGAAAADIKAGKIRVEYSNT